MGADVRSAATRLLALGRGGRYIAASLTAILTAVFAVEGGYIDHKSDPGGATNHGITETVARSKGYRGSMRDLPKWMAEDWLVTDYIVKPGFMPMVVMDPPVAEELVDSAVNFGPARPSKWFQRSLNELGDIKIPVDGKVGPRTIAAYRHYLLKAGRVAACVTMLDQLDARQRAEYDRLVRVNPRLKVFYRGWINKRVGNVDRRRCRP